MKRILFFSCEPGGAEVLIPVIKLLGKNDNYELIVLGYGYALERFAKKSIPAVEIDSITKNDYSILDYYCPDLIITSACSLPSKDMSEKYLWYNAREKNIKTIAFLDQWQNYSIRFSGAGEKERLKYLPDYINCINDLGKKEMIAENFNPDQLIPLGHPYLSSYLEEVQVDTSVIKQNLAIPPLNKVYLFVSEAIMEHYGNSLGYNQYEVLDLFLSNIDKYSKASVIIKLHPKDNHTKYQHVKSNYKGDITLITNELTPYECIGISDIVFGMTSIMLIEAYISGKPVVSIQPNLVGESPLILSRYNYIPTIKRIDSFEFDTIVKGQRKEFNFAFDKHCFMSLIERIL